MRTTNIDPATNLKNVAFKIKSLIPLVAGQHRTSNGRQKEYPITNQSSLYELRRTGYSTSKDELWKSLRSWLFILYDNEDIIVLSSRRQELRRLIPFLQYNTDLQILR